MRPGTGELLVMPPMPPARVLEVSGGGSAGVPAVYVVMIAPPPRIVELVKRPER